MQTVYTVSDTQYSAKVFKLVNMYMVRYYMKALTTNQVVEMSWSDLVEDKQIAIDMAYTNVYWYLQ